jgi:hypothetical protein
MKSLGGSGEMVKKGKVTAEEGLRYAMSLPVATTISGMDSLEVHSISSAVLWLEAAGHFEALLKSLRKRSQLLAADGRMELFKTTKMYDGDEGRQQHHLPLAADLPAQMASWSAQLPILVASYTHWVLRARCCHCKDRTGS